MHDIDIMRKYADILKENDAAYMVDEFTTAYMEAILFAEIDDVSGDAFDQSGFTPGDFSEDALAQIKKDCAQFQDQANLSELDEIHNDSSIIEANAGHDFWLTRAGHGAGFWDGDWPEPHATRLTRLSKKFGEQWVYLGDDNQLHISN